MGRGRLLLSLAVALQASAAFAAAGPVSGLDTDLLARGEAASSSMPAPGLPDASDAVGDAGPAVKTGLDLVAAVGAALGAVAAGLGGIASGLVGLGGALLGAIGALLGAIVGAIVALAGALAAGLAAVAGGIAAGVARHPERLMTPVAGTGVAWGLSALHGKVPSPRALLAPLFSRLERHELLRHDARLRMFEYVRERPGAHLSQIHGAMGLGWGATVYHLRRMREAQLLTARTVGNQLCHFVNGDHHTPEEQQVLAAAKGARAQAIVDYIKLRGASPQHEIARELGMSSALVSWHAKRLEDLGVVERVRAGRECRLALRGAAARVVRVQSVAAAPAAPAPPPLAA